jgi:signal recognition particle receptor subunit beta
MALNARGCVASSSGAMPPTTCAVKLQRDTLGILKIVKPRDTIALVAQVNPLTREVLIKLVYYGPGLGGKTTTLQKVHAASPAETRGKIVSLATPVDRTLYFDFMPLRVGPVHGYPVRLQLFTVPGQVYFNATRKLVLTGADGVVFVADSQRERQDANLESLQNLSANLTEQERSLVTVPHVLQYNKRDLANVLPVSDLNAALNPHSAPSFESSASRGQGVLEPLDELVRLVLLDLERRAVFGAEPQQGEKGPRFEATQDGLRESVSRASEQWNDAVEQTIQAVSTLPPIHKSLPPQRRSVPPRPLFTSSRAPSIPAASRRQNSEPARLPRFDATTPQPTVSAPSGLSWAPAFPPEQAPQVVQLEQDIVEGEFRGAILRCDALCAELLADAAEEHGFETEEKKPLWIALCLGLPAERWRTLRGLIHEARLGAEISELEALDAYSVLLELNRLRRLAARPEK